MIENLKYLATVEKGEKTDYRCGQCQLFKTDSCIFPQSPHDAKPCREFALTGKKKEEEKKQKKPKITATVADLAGMIGIDPRVIQPAGGFTKDFAYEGVCATTEYGDTVWALVWDNGKNRGTEITGQKNAWKSKLVIGEKTWQVQKPMGIHLRSTWTLKNALEYVETGKTKEPAEVYANIEKILRYFVDMDYGTDSTNGKFATATCWVIGTYFFRTMSMYPYFIPHGTKDTGKSTLAATMTYQSYHGMEPIIGASLASMFRIVPYSPTMFVDNAEKFYQNPKMDTETRDIVTFLDGGAYANGAVPRVEGDANSRHVVYYPSFCPKTITTVQGVVGSLASRSIMVAMMRTDKHEYAERHSELKLCPFDEKDTKAIEIRQNRDDMYALRMKLWRKVKESIDSTKSNEYGLISREWDVWMPILGIAKIFCPEKIVEIRKFMKEWLNISKDDVDEEKLQAVQALVLLWQEIGKSDWVSITKYAEILKVFKQEADPKAIVTGSQAGKLLYTLGFVERRKSGSKRLFWLNEKMLRKLAKTIDIELEKEIAEKTDQPTGNWLQSQTTTA